jgi:outer membrane protein assembly factor BamD (BamD/ComL family)
MGRRCLASIVVLIATASVQVGTRAPQVTAAEANARGRYKTGLDYLTRGQYDAALSDFETVARDYPTSTVADEALVEVARIRFLFHGNAEGARAAISEVKKNPDRDAVASAHILDARIRATSSRSAAELRAALNDLDLIRSRFSGSAAAFPEADLTAADLQRMGGNVADALERYRRLILDYSRSPWSPEAHLGAAACLVRLRQPETAVETLQRLRLNFPDAAAAETAAQWNTVVFRLYLRDGRQYRRVPDTAAPVKVPDGVQTWGPRRARRGSPRADRAAHVDRFGRLTVAGKEWIAEETGSAIPVAFPRRPQSEQRIVKDIGSFAVTSLRDLLVADRDRANVVRAPLNGQGAVVWLEERADRLILDADDRVAILNRDSKAIRVFDLDRQFLFAVTAGTRPTDLKDPRDIAFDPLGHLYVLDRGHAAVLVFGTDGKHVSTLAAGDDANAFKRAEAIGVDALGRIVVYDERTQQVHTYH